MALSVFVAGIRRLDRVRGGGWLDCPNCHEHAAQDVVDEMRFVALLGYRFTPVGRRRALVCRRCGYRRPAAAELASLRTAGKPINRAWMLPVGLLPFVVVGLLAVVLLTRHPRSIEDVLTFGPDTAQPVAPVTLRRPLSWNASPNTDDTPPDYTVTDPTQRMTFRLRRITDSSTVAQLVAQHFSDDNGINDTGVPQTPPPATTTQIAGEKALMIRFSYLSTGEQAQTTMYAFFHDGIGYTLTYIADGTSQFDTLDKVADDVNGSLTFTGTETPAPCPTASGESSTTSSGVSAASSSKGSTSTSTTTTSHSSSSPSSTSTSSLPGFATSPQPCVGAGGATTTEAPPSPTP